MTPYQHGNRDGLLSFAMALDATAEAYRGEVAKWRKSRHPAGDRMAENNQYAVMALVAAAATARRLSEALPDDPGEA